MTINSITLPVGYVLENRARGLDYVIRGVLGQGGFGITYAAADTSGQTLAIKEFFPENSCQRNPDGSVRPMVNDASFHSSLNSFYKEAQVLSELSGLPTVVQIYDYFYANDTAYYVMEYVQGCTLQQYLQGHGVLSPSECAGQFRQLMRDIDRFHRRGIIHRDIAPDNIMCCPDGSFKLVDFGAARSFTKNSMLTVNVKKDFAPIEQFSATGQREYTDVYSLAATMYYCFTGRLIPSAGDREIRDTLVQPSQYSRALTSRQEKALLKALAVRGSDRYQSMSEFEAAYFGGTSSSKSGSGRNEKNTASAGGFTESVAMLMEAPLMLGLSLGLMFLAIIFQIAL